MHSLVIVNKPQCWNFQLKEVEVVSAKAYLTNARYSEIRHARVYNLCQSYRYQSLGYYVSLLAEARGHRSFPSITTIQDLKSLSIIRIISDELDQIIQQSLSRIKSTIFTLHVYFGDSVSKQYKQLSKHLYNLFPSPLLRFNFNWNKDQQKWLIQHITPLPLNHIPEQHMPYLFEFARHYFAKKRIRSRSASKLIYDLAILVNPNESAPPSNRKALRHFVEAAENEGMRTKLITKHDYSRIPEFDALFIRETTAVNHYTYRFARRALAENLVVIDDPASILKCTNKVYMAELLKKANVPTPKTVIVHHKNKHELIDVLGLPCVLKQPDGSFSNGVVRITDRLSLKTELQRLLNQSDLIIAQEYVPTPFDWRIGILDKRPLFACKYYMVENHWQIHRWHGNIIKDGPDESLKLEAVPRKILQIATRAASLLGDGFYGVDIKHTKNNILVIEINDNPSIDAGVEDSTLKEELYTHIMQYFLKRIKKKKDLD